MADQYVIGEDGRPYKVAPNQVQGAADAGSVGITRQDAVAQNKANQASDYVDQNWGTVGKALAGVAGGATLGMGPALAANMGIISPENLEAAQQSGAYMAGDVAGMIAPAVLSGGESLLARGAAEGGALGAGRIAAALTPAGLMGEAGGLAERLAGRFLGEAGSLGKFGTSTVKMAARGATEGALINMAQTTSEELIQNKPLSAQAILASAPGGALFGGAIGGLLGGIGAAAAKGVSAAEGAVEGGAIGAGRNLTAETRAMRALKFMGASEKEIVLLSRQEGGVVGALKDYYDIVREGGQSLKSSPGAIAEAASKSVPVKRAVVNDVLKDLDSRFKMQAPSVEAVNQRLDVIASAYKDQLESISAKKLVQDLKDGINGTAAKQEAFKSALTAPVEPTAPTIPRNYPNQAGVRPEWMEYNKAHAAWKTENAAYKEALAAEKEGARRPAAPSYKSWTDWYATRDQLADRVAVAGEGLKGDILKQALSDVDSVINGSLSRTEPELAAKYQAATTQMRNALALEEMSTNKMVTAAQAPSRLKPDNSDAATIGFALLTGADPIIGGGLLAAKKIVLHTSDKLQPMLAEANARAALGASAAGNVATSKARLSNAVAGLLGGAKQAGVRQGLAHRQEASQSTLKGYLDAAEEFTSMAHQERVRETTKALADAGHDQLAQEMALTYGRAVAYINHSKPKDTKQGRIIKSPTASGVGTKEWKFIMKLGAIVNPIGTIERGLADGDLGRDEVQAIKYVYPDLHHELVVSTAQKIVDIRSEGKFVDPSKLASLGTVLDAPVDSTLEKRFIDEVQAAHAANKAPPPGDNQAPPPNTDTTDYQTPLQSTV